MNSIRVRSESEYVIEVNDNGETISFDVQDIGLTSKLVRMIEKIDVLTKRYEIEAQKIAERDDEPYKTSAVFNRETGEKEEKTILTKNQYDCALLVDKFYLDARSAVDEFIGGGACKKIFGDKNYTGMFNDLTDQLKPHFEKMGLDAKSIRENAAKKYLPNQGVRRTIK